MTAQCHRDCRNFAPVDVVKGICHVTQEHLASDSAACGRFDRLPRCRNCGHYKPDATVAGVGKCAESPTAFMAYEEMTAVTCGSYQAS